MAFCFFANRLLEREPAARQRLAPFAGQVVEFRAALLPTVLVTILPGGTLAADGDNPALVVTLVPPLRAQRLDGDPQLAAEVEYLLKTLRWDPEEDLSRVVGDVLAHRMAGSARALAQWPLDAARRIADAAVEYGADEARMLVRRAELAAHAQDLSSLNEAIARLERRLG